MPDTPVTTPSARYRPYLTALFGVIALVAGVSLRCAAVTGELWLDELWSLLKVSDLSNPIDIVTKVNHDNNHILNSLWMWLIGAGQPTPFYRIPALLFSIVLLMALLLGRSLIPHLSSSSRILWLVLVAFSYPLTLYGTEARGYSLVLLCAALTYLAVASLLVNPFDKRAVIACAGCGIVGCLSHAIYALFLAPTVVWLLWRLSYLPTKRNSRVILWCAVAPPTLLACLLTLTFYRTMEIGGAPILPYLEVAASTISSSFGGEALSAVNVNVTGWCVFLDVVVSVVCLIELITWMRSGAPLSFLVGLILVTPWIAVALIQPHFILPRYFIIQVFFSYLLAARFLDRLMRQGRFGVVVALTLVAAYAISSSFHTVDLAKFGRSNFVKIFDNLASRAPHSETTVGGDQDFQNKLRLAYALKVTPSVSNITYISRYTQADVPPQFIIKEVIDAYQVLPDEWHSPQGALYRRILRYPAPQLNGSHVTVYERAD